MLWRRSYDTPPPPVSPNDEYSQFDDPRYASLPPEVAPLTECLQDVVKRMLPYWYERDRARPVHPRHGPRGCPRQLFASTREAS